MNAFIPHSRIAKSLAALLFLSLITTTFITAISAQNRPQSSSSLSALDQLLKDVQDQDGITWKLGYNYDPEVPNQILPADPDNPQFLSLKANMTFVIFDRKQQNTGPWTANGFTKTIRFHCEEVNGNRLNDPPPPYTFRIHAYSYHELILIGQGPQGQINMAYHPVPDATPDGSVLSYKQ